MISSSSSPTRVRYFVPARSRTLKVALSPPLRAQAGPESSRSSVSRSSARRSSRIRLKPFPVPWNTSACGFRNVPAGAAPYRGCRPEERGARAWGAPYGLDGTSEPPAPARPRAAPCSPVGSSGRAFGAACALSCGDTPVTWLMRPAAAPSALALMSPFGSSTGSEQRSFGGSSPGRQRARALVLLVLEAAGCAVPRIPHDRARDERLEAERAQYLVHLDRARSRAPERGSGIRLPARPARSRHRAARPPSRSCCSRTASTSAVSNAGKRHSETLSSCARTRSTTPATVRRDDLATASSEMPVRKPSWTSSSALSPSGPGSTRKVPYSASPRSSSVDPLPMTPPSPGWCSKLSSTLTCRRRGSASRTHPEATSPGTRDRRRRVLASACCRARCGHPSFARRLRRARPGTRARLAPRSSNHHLCPASGRDASGALLWEET